jgi:hypothetical protein
MDYNELDKLTDEQLRVVKNFASALLEAQEKETQDTNK